MGSNNTSSPLDSFPHTHKSSTSAVMSSDDRATPVLRHCSTPAMNSPWASEKLSAISESEAVFEHRNGVSYASRATQSNLHDPPPSSSSSMASVRLTGTPSRYKKGEALGSGSTGTVYQCLDLETGELLAVKEVLRQDLMEAVEKEAKLMSSLAEHPNIIRYRGMRKDERRPFSGPSEVHLHVFTEWMAGGSVSQLIKAYGPLEEGTARRYTYQILQGLSFLHESRIIHRDIKGSNILLGINGNLKLGDLGSSRQLLLASSISSDAQGDGPSSRLSPEVAMSMKGTCYWCPPEVIRMEGHTFSADIYSLGCTVLEMLHGFPPFSGECEGPLQALMLIASITNENELSKRLKGPSASSALCQDFIRLCTRLDPKHRPSAHALLQHPWIVSDPSSTTPKTTTKCQHTGRSPLSQ